MINFDKFAQDYFNIENIYTNILFFILFYFAEIL